MRRVAVAFVALLLALPASAQADNAASRMTMWTSCTDLVAMTDAQLDSGRPTKARLQIARFQAP